MTDPFPPPSPNGKPVLRSADGPVRHPLDNAHRGLTVGRAALLTLSDTTDEVEDVVAPIWADLGRFWLSVSKSW